MTTTVYNIINPFLLKESFSKYTDESAFANYQKIARDYYKLYSKLLKKLNNISGEQLRTKVKSWFFNLSLENRIKICTVENELFCNFIYQMFLRTQIDKSIEFYPKTELTEIGDLSSNLIYKNFIEETSCFEYNLDSYFMTKSDKYSSYFDVNDYSMLEDGIYSKDDKDKNYNINLNEFITNDIRFYSVHHKPYPDCFCLSPCFLLNKERFDTTFVYFGNTDYFKNLIKPFYNQEKNIYGYFLPEWFNHELTNLSITKYIIAFTEQTIMIKYFLNNYFINKSNKNNKNESLISLINDVDLNRFFLDRKTVINYFNINYNDTNAKKKLLNETDIDTIFDNILKNNDINNKIIFFKNFQRNSSYNNSRQATLVQPLLDINNNYIYNSLYDDIRLFFHNNAIEQNNYVINKVKSNIIQTIELSDNIGFTDYLLYQNISGLWENDYFIKFEIISHFINLFNEQIYKDLLEEETTTKKKKRKKKKKKQNSTEDEININNSNDNSNDINKSKIICENIDLECYKELFKDDEEKILYASYYLSVNYDLKKKFKTLKDNKLKSITKKNKKQDIKEIYNYIKNELILKYIINKVIHLQPDNYVKFFDNKEIKPNDNDEKKVTKIKGLKLLKKNKKQSDDDNEFLTINFNLNEKNISNEINLNQNKNEKLLNNELKEINKIKIDENNKEEINQNEIIILDKNNDNDKINDNSTRVTNSDKKEETNINDKISLKDNNINLNQIQLKFNENKKIRSNSNNSRKNSTQKKKQKKENAFFLFDTVKAKKEKSNKSKSPNTSKIKQTYFEQNSLNIKILKINDTNNSLSFYEKLHNSILKNEKKVNMILQHLSIYKNYVIEEIKQMINNTYENNYINYSIDMYGSYTTGLMIEASDIDIKIKLCCIKKEEFSAYFTSLYKKLISENKFEKIIPISTASVPVIKLIIDIEKFIKNKKDLQSEFSKFKQQNFFKNYIFDKNELIQIRVDITFIINYKTQKLNENETNKEILNKLENDKIKVDNNINKEISNVIYIKEQLEKHPEIKPILILLKRYFYVKNMNSSFEGGLSSYNLFLLILSYSKYIGLTHSKIKNLGYYLIQFLEFFGKYLDLKSFTVNINSPYIYELTSFNNYNSAKSLVILDPLTGLNASKSSYKILEIQNMFLISFNFFEKERIDYENEIYQNEINDKRDHDKNQQFEGILGLKKISKNEYSKKNKKDKNSINIIDKFFFS